MNTFHTTQASRQPAICVTNRLHSYWEAAEATPELFEIKATFGLLLQSLYKTKAMAIIAFWRGNAAALEPWGAMHATEALAVLGRSNWPLQN